MSLRSLGSRRWVMSRLLFLGGYLCGAFSIGLALSLLEWLILGDPCPGYPVNASVSCGGFTLMSIGTLGLALKTSARARSTEI